MITHVTPSKLYVCHITHAAEQIQTYVKDQSGDKGAFYGVVQTDVPEVDTVVGLLTEINNYAIVIITPSLGGNQSLRGIQEGVRVIKACCHQSKRKGHTRGGLPTLIGTAKKIKLATKKDQARSETIRVIIPLRAVSEVDCKRAENNPKGALRDWVITHTDADTAKAIQDCYRWQEEREMVPSTTGTA